MTEVYRETSIGRALTDTLDELVTSKQLRPEFALKILENFDQIMFHDLNHQVRTKMTMKGKLHEYRYCDGLWQFHSKDTIIKIDSTEKFAKHLRIFACVPPEAK